MRNMKYTIVVVNYKLQIRAHGILQWNLRLLSLTEYIRNYTEKKQYGRSTQKSDDANQIK